MARPEPYQCSITRHARSCTWVLPLIKDPTTYAYCVCVLCVVCPARSCCKVWHTLFVVCVWGSMHSGCGFRGKCVCCVRGSRGALSVLGMVSVWGWGKKRWMVAIVAVTLGVSVAPPTQHLQNRGVERIGMHMMWSVSGTTTILAKYRHRSGNITQIGPCPASKSA